MARGSAAIAQLTKPAIRRKVGYFMVDEEDARKTKKQRKEGIVDTEMV